MKIQHSYVELLIKDDTLFVKHASNREIAFICP